MQISIFQTPAVLVPTFNDPKDRIALGILSELITDRPVVGIHAVDLVWGLGTPSLPHSRAASLEISLENTFCVFIISIFILSNKI